VAGDEALNQAHALSASGNAVTLPPQESGGVWKLGAIWLLFGGKAGDNAQVKALGAGVAAQLGWDYKVKQLQHHHTELLLHLLARPGLGGITAVSREALTPPWPDLVITAGRRNELVALWIKQRSPATRVVHIGRPWCQLHLFDLVIATPQYRLEGFPNVLINLLPLNQVDESKMTAAAETWRDQFAQHSSPRTVLLLGGNSGGYVLDTRQAQKLARALSALMQNGSLLISSSRRTPAAFLETLLAGLDDVAYCYRWDEPGDNPYFGLLAWGERFVVTEDSVSMTAEAIVTGKPVFVAAIDSAQPDDGTPWWRRAGNFAWKPLTHRLAMRFAPDRFHRDVRRWHQNLVASGLLRWLVEKPVPEQSASAPAAELCRQLQQRDLVASVERVAALFTRSAAD
jgi:uncharacterized protein